MDDFWNLMRDWLDDFYNLSVGGNCPLSNIQLDS
jgi:hypothetical protein